MNEKEGNSWGMWAVGLGSLSSGGFTLEAGVNRVSHRRSSRLVSGRVNKHWSMVSIDDDGLM